MSPDFYTGVVVGATIGGCVIAVAVLAAGRVRTVSRLIDQAIAETTGQDVYVEDLPVLPYVMPDWTTDDRVDGDQIAIDTAFAALSRRAAETWEKAR